MNKQQVFEIFAIEDLRLLPEAILSVLFGSIEERDKVYKKLLEANQYDLSRDWFQQVYEDEMSERKKKGQDFTPYELSVICSKLTDQRGSVHEPTAGNGSMVIADWWERCRKLLPWEHFPSEHMVTCWELSDRSLPILLLNLSIRGIMGYVYHGDVLEGTVKQKYILLNQKDDTLAFSEIVKAGLNDRIVKEE